MCTTAHYAAREMERSKGVIALAALLTWPAAAHQGEARFTVSAVVPAQVTLTALAAPSRLTVTAADVARGYKDVSAHYRVHTNDRKGYLLRFTARAGLTRQVLVLGLDADVVLRDEQVDIHRPASGGVDFVALGFRFVLEPAVRPGTYALPVHLVATPL